jgi:signal transduction histidine kinase
VPSALSTPARIVIVDDDHGLLRLMEKIVRREGFTAITTSLGAEALDWLAKNDADLLLLDLKLPDFGGSQFMDQLEAAGRSIPFVIITGQGDERVAVEMMKRGALDYLVKDVQFIEFLPDVIRRALGKLETDRRLAAAQAALEVRTRELHAALNEMQAISYSISHDMRAPLRSMQSYASFLVDEYANNLDEEGIRFLQQIIRSAVRLDTLIRDAWNYTKILNDRLPIEPIDLDRLVRDIVETDPATHAGNMRVEINGSLPMVMGNVALLTQCVSSLLSNAAKFVAPGVSPRLEIRAEERDSSWIRVWFKDNGIGIAPEHHERIFGIFSRIHSDSEYEGTGIGLSIVQKTVERMGGRVGVESRLHEGSSFWIELKKVEA